jgi:hypothetical protein
MQNETKLSSEMINSLFQFAKRGKGGQESVRSILNQTLSEGQKKSLGQIMSDPQKLREMLSSPEAKALMEKLGGSGQGEGGNGGA